MSNMSVFLNELGLESLAMTFGNEDISVSELRKLSTETDKFYDQMRALNVPLSAAGKIHGALRAHDEADASVSAKKLEDSSAAIAALAAMAKAKTAAAPPMRVGGGGGASDMDSILAAALGRVATVATPPPPPPLTLGGSKGGDLRKQISNTPGSDEWSVGSLDPSRSGGHVGLVESGLSYDSWQQLGKTGGKPPAGPKVNSALLAYRSRGTADVAAGEGGDPAAYSAEKNGNTQIVLANGQTKEKTKEWIPVYMSTR